MLQVWNITATEKLSVTFGIAGLIPQSLELRGHLNLTSLGWCHKSGECANSYACGSVCLCTHSCGGARQYSSAYVV